jgi:putative sigma-54 modulation protein
MNIQITSRKFKAKESLKEFIQDQLQWLDKFYDDIMDVKVVLSYKMMDDSQKTAEIILNIPGNIITVTSTTDDFKKSISECVEKAETQLKKIKGKKLDSKRKEKPEIKFEFIEEDVKD